jgi:hypothetical protein
MSFNYTPYHNNQTTHAYMLHHSRQNPPVTRRRVRIMDSITPMSAPVMGRRQVFLTPDSPSTHVRVVDTEGRVIAELARGARKTEMRGRGDIAAVLVTINGQERVCDMAPALEWIDAATHIGVSTTTTKGGPTCTLIDMSAGVSVPDMRGALPGQRCVYVTDQKGNSGLECH